MGTRERRERERLDTRERILSAAREMFAEEGFEAVTMRAIAERIEYTPTALYHHFPSKQALVTELCHSDFERLARHFQAGGAPADPIERLNAIGRGYLQFAEEHPSHYRFMFMTVMPVLEHGAEYLAKAKNNPERDAYAFLRTACQEAIDQQRLRPEFKDADAVAQILWGTIHGQISLRIAKHTDDFVNWTDLRQTTEQAMDTLMRGMLRSA